MGDGRIIINVKFYNGITSSAYLLQVSEAPSLLALFAVCLVHLSSRDCEEDLFLWRSVWPAESAGTMQRSPLFSSADETGDYRTVRQPLFMRYLCCAQHAAMLINNSSVTDY